MDTIKVALLAALFLLPASAALIHSIVHPTVIWVLYVCVFDAIVVTALFYFDKTRPYGFWLNTGLAAAAIIYHATFSLIQTLSDNMIVVADFAIGYALYAYALKPVKVKRVKK